MEVVGAIIVVCLVLGVLGYAAESLYRALAARGWFHPSEPDLYYRARGRRSSVAETEDGQVVRLKGKLRADSEHAPLTARFSGRSCLFCLTTFEQYGYDPDSDRAYDVRESLREGVDWVLLEDDSGIARVCFFEESTQLAVLLDEDRARYYEAVPMEQVEAFLEAADSSPAAIGEGFPWGDSKLPGDYRIRQLLLCEGDEVVVGGRCTQKAGPPLGGASSGGVGAEGAGGVYRVAPMQTELYSIGDEKRTPLLVTNRPKLVRKLGGR